MNERIQEFRRQANEYTNSRVDGPSPIWFECFDKKFADLIVRECMAVGFNAVYNAEDDSNAIAVYKEIKEHFGVEE